jgi:hypothetical protein
MQPQLFGGTPDSKPTLDPKRAASIAIGVMALAGGLLLAQKLATPKAVPWSVGGGKLQIHARIWNDDLPLSQLQPDQARVLDLTQEAGWQPKKKLWGFGVSRFHAGLFELQNGESVDLYLAGETIAVLIPRRGNVPVMVGVRDPQAFLAALEGAAQ